MYHGATQGVTSLFFYGGKLTFSTKLATSVGRTLEEKRTQLHKQVQVGYLLPLLGPSLDTDPCRRQMRTARVTQAN